jgi:Flp pilus assembly protein TadD
MRPSSVLPPSIGRAYDRNPKDATVGMHYASVLTMGGRFAGAGSHAAGGDPQSDRPHRSCGLWQGAGRRRPVRQGAGCDPAGANADRPDWQLLSAEGAILDQMGDPAGARNRYRKALDIMPNEPSILSNLGMSYVLQGDLRTAETYLASAVRQPGADSRVRQNLALVVGLQGRFGEAERSPAPSCHAEQAQANVSYLRSMLSQQNAWNKLKDSDRKNTN